jgi:hypothetical protein
MAIRSELEGKPLAKHERYQGLIAVDGRNSLNE